MARRKRMSRKSSRRLFSKTARRVHRKNSAPIVNRGGFRI